MILAPWQLMWVLAVLIFLVCKIVTWMEVERASLLKTIGYFVAWPGLDARAFFDRTVKNKPTVQEYLFAVCKMTFGLFLYFVIAGSISPGHDYLVGWIGMIGIVFTLHFGLFHLLSCIWRSEGVEAEPLMNWPILSTSLGDFWGKRWNTAFSTLTYRFMFKPLTRSIDACGSLVVCFLVSGIVHDLVISIPAGGGVGGPTIYFLLQASALCLESSLQKGKLLEPWGKRLYAFVFLIGPLYLLFHRSFIMNVIIPFMHATGAL